MEDPLNRPPSHDHDGDADPREIDLTDRCWKDGIEGIWLTDFPPPQDFDGYQSCDYGNPDERYERACTAEEVAILDADDAAALAAERAEDEALRDAWFALLGTNPIERNPGQIDAPTDSRSEQCRPETQPDSL